MVCSALQALLEAFAVPPPQPAVEDQGPCDKHGQRESSPRPLSASACGRGAGLTRCAPRCRCDGPHATARCPYFKKSRDDHEDATRNLGRKAGGGGDDGGDDGNVVLRGARVVPQPGDGSCLFHSLASQIGGKDVDADALRDQSAAFVAGSPDERVAGTPVRDWIRWESGMEPAAYAQRMRRAGQWGGAIELAVIAHLRGVVVEVYERDGGTSFRLISAFGRGEKAVRLLYSGRVHYDAIVKDRHGMV
jgi:hypothetical protein